MVKILPLQNLTKKYIFIYFLFLFIGCMPDAPHAYNPQKAKKIYTQQTQNKAVVKISTNEAKYNEAIFKDIAYWNIYFDDRLPFMGVDSILDTENAKYIFKDLAHFKIGDIAISPYQIQKFPLQNISYLYNQKYDSYYAWYPQEWAVFVLKNDSIMAQEYIIKSCSLDIIKSALSSYEDRLIGLAPDYQDSRRSLKWENKRWYNFYIVETKKDQKYTTYSLQKTFHYNLLSAIISEMDNPKNTDSIINYLQNQCNFSGHSYYDSRCIYFVDSPMIDKKNKQYLYQMTDTCKFKYSPYPFLDIYEKLSPADLFKLELIYPDFTKESVPEIAEYAQKTKPTFIYFKRAYRSGYHNEPYYYFIFYYIDFQPFMPPRLRDMQVVFPCRFGLS